MKELGYYFLQGGEQSVIYGLGYLDITNAIWDFGYESISNNDCNFYYYFNADTSDF